MLKNFWYGLEFSKDITSKPQQLLRLNQILAAYRTASGKSVLMPGSVSALRGGVIARQNRWR